MRHVGRHRRGTPYRFTQGRRVVELPDSMPYLEAKALAHHALRRQAAGDIAHAFAAGGRHLGDVVSAAFSGLFGRVPIRDGVDGVVD